MNIGVRGPWWAWLGIGVLALGVYLRIDMQETRFQSLDELEKLYLITGDDSYTLHLKLGSELLSRVDYTLSGSTRSKNNQRVSVSQREEKRYYKVTAMDGLNSNPRLHRPEQYCKSEGCMFSFDLEEPSPDGLYTVYVQMIDGSELILNYPD